MYKDAGVCDSGLNDFITSHDFRATTISFLSDSNHGDASVAIRTGHTDTDTLTG